MAKSRKGKKASRSLCIKKMNDLIENKFKNVNFDDRTKLFQELEKWAKKELSEEQCEIFLEALYNADCTQDIQMTLGLEKALDKFMGGK